MRRCQLAEDDVEDKAKRKKIRKADPITMSIQTGRERENNYLIIEKLSYKKTLKKYHTLKL